MSDQSRQRDLALIARAAVEAIGPLLARLGERLAEIERLLPVLEQKQRELAAAPPPIAGRDGRDGKEGRDGKDATFREPTDYEAGRTYAHGVIVRHRGGLWHAHRQTEQAPELERSGWTLIVNGINAISLAQGEDLRSFVIEIEPSVGQPVKKVFTVPALIFRGVHESQREYGAGDVITFQGSMWIAKRTTTKPPPGLEAVSFGKTGDDWQLAVKKGRDGKDGERGADAPTYHGFYDPRVSYPVNALVRTHAGLWLSKRKTDEPPPANGGESKAWQMFLPMVTH